MSLFLPEGAGTAPGIPSLASANPEPTEDDVALMQRVLSAAAHSPNRIPDAFMAYVLDYIQANNLVIPIGQVFGFTQASPKIGTTEPETSVTSTTFATFTNAPSLTGLSDGSYILLYGAAGEGDDAATGSSLFLGASVNGATPSVYAESTLQGYYASISRGVLATLSNVGSGSSNTVALQAKTAISGHTSKVRDVWLMAIKISN